MNGRRISAAVIIGTILAGGMPASAGSPKLAAKSGESISPSAKGPASYQATANGPCAGSLCIVTFGKKANKIRRISNISCLLVSGGEAVGGVVEIDEQQITFMPVSSRGVIDTSEFAMSALAIDFIINRGQELVVELAAGMTPISAGCTIHGTIE